jgi:serine/threonine protein kinase
MATDKSQLDTLTLNETSSGPLNETTLPQQPGLIGQTIDERYVIESAIGQGGVGAVYLARDRKLHDKRVVIKILLDRSLQNEWVVQKFQQEKEALARVDHPGVVGILDTGELPDGKAYLVMQFIDGVTLRSQVKPEGMPLARAAEIIKQIGRALSAAHERGIFHRDLKPENIMLQSFGRGEEQVKIIDFGIAKLKDSLVAPSTVTGATGRNRRLHGARAARRKIHLCGHRYFCSGRNCLRNRDGPQAFQSGDGIRIARDAAQWRAGTASRFATSAFN